MVLASFVAANLRTCVVMMFLEAMLLEVVLLEVMLIEGVLLEVKVVLLER